MRSPVAALLAPVLGAACALLVACGGTTNKHLLSTSRADALSADVDAVASAVDGGDCTAARRAVAKLVDEVNGLPSTTDPRLRARLVQGVDHVGALAVKDCHAQTTTTQTTTTQTSTTPTTTTQTTPTQTTPTQTTPTQTTPTQTTPTTPHTTPTTPHTTTTPGGGTGGSGVPKSGTGAGAGAGGGAG